MCIMTTIALTWGALFALATYIIIMGDLTTAYVPPTTYNYIEENTMNNTTWCPDLTIRAIRTPTTPSKERRSLLGFQRREDDIQAMIEVAVDNALDNMEKPVPHPFYRKVEDVMTDEMRKALWEKRVGVAAFVLLDRSTKRRKAALSALTSARNLNSRLRLRTGKGQLRSASVAW